MGRVSEFRLSTGVSSRRDDGRLRGNESACGPENAGMRSHPLLTERPERNPVVERQPAIHRNRSPRYVPRKAIA